MVKEETIAEIRKNLKSDKLLLGARTCLKQLKLGNLQKLFLASNCPKDLTEDVEHYSRLGNVELVKLDIANDELGILCKRQHTVVMLGVLK